MSTSCVCILEDASGSLLGELDLSEFIEFFREYPELKNKVNKL